MNNKYEDLDKQMTKEIFKKRTTYEWEKVYNVAVTDFRKNVIITVLDPDGWDRKDLENSYKELITKEEFNKRLGSCTVQFEKSTPEVLKEMERTEDLLNRNIL